jgi:hypothetical protein
MSDMMSSEVVTANSAANGALTVGNGFVSGIFGSSIAIGLTFRGGTIANSADAVWTSNVVIQTGNQFLVGNTTVNSLVNSTAVIATSGQFATANIPYFNQTQLNFANTAMTDLVVTTTGTSIQNFDTFGLTLYRSAEYQVSIKDNTSNAYSVSKILVVHDGGNILQTEYGLLSTNGTLAIWSTATNATSLMLQATPMTANLTIRAVRTSLKV